MNEELTFPLERNKRLEVWTDGGSLISIAADDGRGSRVQIQMSRERTGDVIALLVRALVEPTLY